jgi:transcription elongation GreA/GreB family factor
LKDESMTVKTKLYQHCVDYAQQRIVRIQEEISRAQSSANEETKSSVGDKYETSRSMAQLEVERNMVQLKEAEKLQSTLQGLGNSIARELVIPGSLVNTSEGVFYIAISLGAITLDKKQYFIVSADSPIGKLMLGKRVGDSMTWNNKQYTVQSIE